MGLNLIHGETPVGSQPGEAGADLGDVERRHGDGGMGDLADVVDLEPPECEVDARRGVQNNGQERPSRRSRIPDATSGRSS
jgi:hypothetical protein